MHAVIVAGGVPGPDDPLFPDTQGQPKALIDLCGRPMVSYVEQACYGCPSITSVTIVGLDSIHAPLFDSRSAHLPDQGGLVANTRAGLEYALSATGPGHIVAMSGDIPLLQADHITSFLAGCIPRDKVAYYRFVRHEVVEGRFPNARRTYTRLRSATATQADLFLLHTDLLASNDALWESLANARKQPWRMARLVGIGVLLKLLLRRLTLDDLAQTAERLLGGPVSVGFLNAPEPAMDVDKPHHLALVRALCTDSAEF